MKIASGIDVFNLVDRHGIPLDIVVLEFRDKGIAFNVPEFIDTALKHGWTSKRIKWMLKSSCIDERALPLIDKYIEYYSCSEQVRSR